MDFVDKKEKLADLIEQYSANKETEQELLNFVKELKQDTNFTQKPLFSNILEEISQYLNQLSPKELKQRILMIRTYIE